MTKRDRVAAYNRITRVLAAVLARGFDQSTLRTGLYGDYIVYPRCSECETVVISGVATHENGCHNDTHECKGCNNRIPVRQDYCEDCR